MTTTRKTLRWAEMLALFVGGPLLLWIFPEVLARGLFLFLLLMGAACMVKLILDKDFDNRTLWNVKAFKDAAGWIVLRWVIASALLTALFGLLSGSALPGLAIDVPTGLFSIFLIEEPMIGPIPFGHFLPIAILLGYPWLSVYPQNVIYRAFFCQRYKPILGTGWILIITNAAAFSFGHIMFGNWVVLLLTFIGGILFTRTYLRTESMLAAVVEHAMYGIFCFYVGVGVFLFYGGSG